MISYGLDDARSLVAEAAPEPATNAGPGDPLDHMSSRDYRRLAGILENLVGIRLPPGKQTMVETRLRRRIRELGLPGLDAYCQKLFEQGDLESELVHLIDAITTNKTDFFREPDHFDYLKHEAVPRLLDERTRDRPLKVWSAACSSGAEPYTLAMVLAEMAQSRPFRFSILGTDICTQVLYQAINAVYPEEMVAPIPEDLRRRYVMRSRNPAARQVRIVPELRGLVQWMRLNLMDASYPVDRDIDIIFCRNVLIYFDRSNQLAVVDRLCSHLRPGGYLFLGHAECLAGGEIGSMRPTAATIFRRVEAGEWS